MSIPNICRQFATGCSVLCNINFSVLGECAAKGMYLFHCIYCLSIYLNALFQVALPAADKKKGFSLCFSPKFEHFLEKSLTMICRSFSEKARRTQSSAYSSFLDIFFLICFQSPLVLNRPPRKLYLIFLT